MWLSPNFHLSEFITSQEAARRGISNAPTPEVIDNLTDLSISVLEKVRAEFGPVRVSSGYRSPELNSAIGGAKNSQHMTGMAADIEVPGVDNCVLAKWIADNLEFDQLILEFHVHSEGPNSGWVHVSYNIMGNKREILTASRVNGRTVYTKGLILG